MLRLEDERSFKSAVEAFRRETPPWQFAFGFDESAAFSDYVKQLEGHSRGTGVPEGFVPNTFLVGVVDSMIVGRLSLRHTLNESLARIGRSHWVWCRPLPAQTRLCDRDAAAIDSHLCGSGN